MDLARFILQSGDKKGVFRTSGSETTKFCGAGVEAHGGTVYNSLTNCRYYALLVTCCSSSGSETLMAAGKPEK